MLTNTFPVLLATRLVLGAGATAGFTYPLLAGVLGHVSWHAPFAIYLIGVPLGVATLIAVPAGIAAAGDEVDGASASRPGRIGGTIRLLRARPQLLGLCGIWVATAGLMMVLAVFLPRRLDQLGIHDTVLVAIYSMVVSGATASLAGMTYARVRRRLSYPVLLRTAVLCWTAAFVCFADADHSLPLLLVPA